MSTKKRPNILWTEQEWQTVALSLLKVRPEYLRAPVLKLLKSTDLRDAMAGLPPERRRPVLDNGGKTDYAKKLLTVFAAIRANLDAQVVMPVAAPAEAPPALSRGERISQSQRGNPKIRWSSTEWHKLATELFRLNPHANFLTSATLAGLEHKEIKEAQRVLPLERRRVVHGMAMARTRLVEQFKIIQAEHQRIALNPPPAALAESVPPAPIAAPAPVVAPTPIAAPRADAAVNPYEAAFAPLLRPFIALFAGEIAQLLLPQIQALLQQPAPPPRTMAAALPSGAERRTIFKPESEPSAPYRTKIGLIGPMSVQAQAIATDFPQFEFTAMDSGPGGVAATMRSMDRIIGMTDKMNHSTDGILKTHFKDRYTRVTGGTSSIKRQIEVWIAAGELA